MAAFGDRAMTSGAGARLRPVAAALLARRPRQRRVPERRRQARHPRRDRAVRGMGVAAVQHHRRPRAARDPVSGGEEHRRLRRPRHRPEDRARHQSARRRAATISTASSTGHRTCATATTWRPSRARPRTSWPSTCSARCRTRESARPPSDPKQQIQRTRAAYSPTPSSEALRRPNGVLVDGLEADGTPSTHASQIANAYALAFGLVPPGANRLGRRLRGRAREPHRRVDLHCTARRLARRGSRRRVHRRDHRSEAARVRADPAGRRDLHLGELGRAPDRRQRVARLRLDGAAHAARRRARRARRRARRRHASMSRHRRSRRCARRESS